ncbi:mitochondrial folate carrier protein [Nemania sp. FL0916]|nr:mitochondrial folate carrier protein [Nemania sp. FL0916]
MTHHDAGLSPASVETVAGLTAGSVATLVVHPLDIVKTRMQIHRSSSSSSSTHAASTRTAGAGVAPAPAPTLTTISVLRGLTSAPHPVAALYRGLTPNLLGNASSWASFFFFKVRAENALLAIRARQFGGDADAVALAPQDYFVASGLAGIFTQVLTNPIWVLKTRMLSSDRGAVGAYSNVWAGALHILRTEGWRGFYRGLGIGLFGVSHGAVQFAVYDPLKQVYLKRRQSTAGNASRADRVGNPQMTNEATLIISSVAKLVAGAVTYPYQVIRSRLQNYDAEERFGRGIRGVVKRTLREEGWRGLYRGIIPGVVRVMPATWVTFLVYENSKYYLPRWTRNLAQD